MYNLSWTHQLIQENYPTTAAAATTSTTWLIAPMADRPVETYIFSVAVVTSEVARRNLLGLPSGN